MCGSGPPQAESRAEFADRFVGTRVAIGKPARVAATCMPGYLHTHGPPLGDGLVWRRIY